MEKINPLISDVSGRIAGITVSLPTQGLFYRRGVIADGVNPGAIEVRPISIIDEMNFKDPFKIISGLASREMIKRACPAILAPEELCKVDVDLIMIAAKAASHGSKVDLAVKCQNEYAVKRDSNNNEVIGHCEAAFDINVDLDRIMLQYVPVGSPQEWQVKLPNGQIVQLMPLPYEAVIKSMMDVANQTKLLKQLEINKKDKDVNEITKVQEQNLDMAAKMQINLLLASIVYVTTSTGTQIFDKVHIGEWISAMPAPWISTVNEALNQKSDVFENYGVARYACPECSYEQKITVNVDQTSFFSQGSRKRTR